MEKNDIEDKLADLCGNLKTVRSSLLVLQQALLNTYDNFIQSEDIDNHLELLIEKFDKTLDNFEEITNSLCT